MLKKIIISASTNKKLSEFKFGQIKREVLKKENIGNIPQNTELIPVYRKLVKSGKISSSLILENVLRKKKMRTQSGIASITVITPDFGCPGKCVYCPTEKGMPKSYLSNEPAVMRAIANEFDPFRQVRSRIDALKAQGHKTDKIELIIAGGTWSAIPEDYQIWFVKECFGAANGTLCCHPRDHSCHPRAGGDLDLITSLDSRRSLSRTAVRDGNDKGEGGNDNLIWKALFKEQKKNESTKNRIVGLTLETRPDWINEEEIKRMRLLGCTRVELGVQSIYDDVLKKCARGHTIKETINATKLLKDAGFKINYHIMLGLPGSTPKKDEIMVGELFKNPDFQPDMLKIYPCVVLKGTPLYRLYKRGEYKPYSDNQIVKILKEAKTKIPEYCRVVRVIRDIPTPSIVAGGKVSNLREVIHQEMAKEGKMCRCIRCREIKDLKIETKNLKLKRQDYSASGGREIFLSFEDVKNDKLVALLRLRIPYSVEATSPNFVFSVLNNAALIREVHTYGEAEKINTKGETQHLGLGKRLLKEAEKTAKKEFGFSKIAVISGVGVRDYYRKSGYKLKDTYMVKGL